MVSRRHPIGRAHPAGPYTVRQIGPTRRRWYVLRPDGRRAILAPFSSAGAAIHAAAELARPPPTDGPRPPPE